MKNISWILGSQSPRRKELLVGIGIEFEVRIKDTEEVYPDSLPANEVPEFLATLKAAALLPDLTDNEVIICADTVVILDGKILGKPFDYEDARQMLSKLSGKKHTVITGVFIGSKDRSTSFSERTDVEFETLSDNEITYYIEKYMPFDKAGSYGVQEWIGYVAVKRMEGTYTNVMGLPTNRLYKEIQKFI
ncbi:Maf family nucleotide pyrophosphatase [Fluviicola taffensis]|uniref:dTTP/UTP pyrophosphatase n=1 Tax=Fluviicola taffensis (strain DSM 16823 / NCIMB 13979 / RW262) TaxID=755732 RepID=F2IH54_FLUTR|nr:Maf family nucleotide pyrophosphatase [Fluviicola taffensis]AEA45868.1 Septum formation protein Maf [Fluviicola taffensis DSM 16823]